MFKLFPWPAPAPPRLSHNGIIKTYATTTRCRPRPAQHWATTPFNSQHTSSSRQPGHGHGLPHYPTAEGGPETRQDRGNIPSVSHCLDGGSRVVIVSGCCRIGTDNKGGKLAWSKFRISSEYTRWQHKTIKHVDKYLPSLTLQCFSNWLTITNTWRDKSIKSCKSDDPRLILTLEWRPSTVTRMERWAGTDRHYIYTIGNIYNIYNIRRWAGRTSPGLHSRLGWQSSTSARARARPRWPGWWPSVACDHVMHCV